MFNMTVHKSLWAWITTHTHTHTDSQDRDRYKRFDRRADVRKAHVLKHIGSVQVGGRWSYSQSHAIDALEKLQEEGKLRCVLLYTRVVGLAFQLVVIH